MQILTFEKIYINLTPILTTTNRNHNRNEKHKHKHNHKTKTQKKDININIHKHKNKHKPTLTTNSNSTLTTTINPERLNKRRKGRVWIRSLEERFRKYFTFLIKCLYANMDD